MVKVVTIQGIVEILEHKDKHDETITFCCDRCSVGRVDLVVPVYEYARVRYEDGHINSWKKFHALKKAPICAACRKKQRN